MKPITVSVGPLAAANALAVGGTGVAVTAPGQVNFTGAQTSQFLGQCSWVTGQPIVTVVAVTSGAVAPGMQVNNFNFPFASHVVGLAPGSPVSNGVGSQWIVYPPPNTGTSGAIRGNPVASFDAPRQVLITNTQAAPVVFTVYGTDGAGNPIQETLAANGGNLTTSQNFLTVTGFAITGGNTTATTVNVGSAATATTPWVNFDPWADPDITKQIAISGAPNFTVQVTNDDPNSRTNPVAPGAMTWFPDPDAGGFVGGSANVMGKWQFCPLYARILLNSGAGSVTGTFVQTGVVQR